MRVPTRIGAHSGAWAVVVLLSTAAGAVAAGVATLVERTDDEALRLMVQAAPSYLDRDLVFVRQAEGALAPIAEATALPERLPARLRDVTEVVWGFQRTTVALAEGAGARLVGRGVTTEPDGQPPVISFHVQTGLDRETSMVSGRPPTTRAGTGTVEVMLAADVAEVLRVRTGGEYVAVTAGLPAREVPVRVSGVFAARDPAAPVWQAEPLLLETALTPVANVPDPPRAVRAVLVTDEAGMAVLSRPELIRDLEPLTGARMRLDAARLDRGWAAAAPTAVAPSGPTRGCRAGT